MAYSGYTERKGSMGRRTQEYGYGMDDIQRASERLGRDQAMNTFRTNQQIKNACLIYTSPSQREATLYRMKYYA